VRHLAAMVVSLMVLAGAYWLVGWAVVNALSGGGR
jgi:hypothetical protein